MTDQNLGSDSSPTRKTSSAPYRPLFEQMEERVLFDAVPIIPLDGEALLPDDPLAPPPMFEESSAGNSSTPQGLATSPALRDAVFVDKAVVGYELLVRDLLENRRADVYFINSGSDGLQQIADQLADKSGYESVHILSHGDDAKLRLGDAVISGDQLSGRYAEQLRTIGEALTAHGDILIYGCELASSEQGQRFVQEFARLTGADVAASVDETGLAALGGNWMLEYQFGQLQSEVVVSVDLQNNWNVLLATPPMEFFVTLDEQGIYDANEKILNEGAYGNVSQLVNTTIGIVANNDNTIIYYDHHEDGYEADLEAPVDVTTEIWGNNDPTDGIAPGYITDVINAGDIVILQNQIDLANPPTAGSPQFDGTDRFASYSSLAVTRGAWHSFPGTPLAGTTEVADVTRWGTDYIVPIGENTVLNNLFEYTGMFIMSAADGTTVDVDVDGDGIDDLNLVLAQGESYHIDGGIQEGATVNASANVGVNLITGDRDSGVDSRWYMLKPSSDWSDSYMSPAGTTNAAGPASLILYNPDTTDLTVDIETRAGTITRTVSAGTTLVETLAVETPSSAARVSSTDGRAFYAVMAMDTDAAHTAFDWGYSLLPENLLSEMVLTGWAPGSSDLSVNGSPIYVTANADTTLFVDFDGDSTTGLLVDPYGRRYDANYNLTRLESLTLFDNVNNDNDQTGTRIYTLDGVDIAAAWGQDPSVAGGGSPYLDMGTVLLPFPLPDIQKSVEITTDFNSNMGGDPGDILTWTITVTNRELFSLGSPVLYDTVPTNTTYISGTTTVDGITIADDFIGGTLLPLDEGGYTLVTIMPGETRTVTFQTSLDPFAPVYTSVTNTAIVDSSIGTSGATAPMVINTQPPVIDLDGDDSTAAGQDYLGTFTEDGGPISLYDFIDGDASITDPDSGYLTQFTVHFVDPQVDDFMTIAGSLPPAISISSQTATDIVLTGTATLADYLTALQSIRFENTSDTPDLTDRHFEFEGFDGTFTSSIATATIQIQNVNDAPVLNNLDATPTYIEDGVPVVLDSDVTVNDIELDQIDNYAGATLTLSRSGGANADDIFSAQGTLGPLAQGGNLTIGATIIGTVTTNSAGTLLLTFNSNATKSLVDQAMQQIAYENTNNAPPASVAIDFVLSDGNTGTQGSGGPLSDAGTVIVSITPTNDTPIAVDDLDATDEDTVLNVAASGVLTNDNDPDGDPLTVTSFDAISAFGALVTVNPDGSYSYDPTSAYAIQSLAPTQTLNDTFTYTVEDPSGASATATVTITITGLDDGLRAFDDTNTTDEETAISAIAPGVLVNDGDPDGGVALVNPILDYVATDDTSGNSIWETVPANPSYDWNLIPAVVKNTSPTTSLPGITESYVFDGSGGGTASSFSTLGGSRNPASFEIWFKPTDAVGNEVLFETGGSGDGTSIILNGSNIEFNVKDNANTLQLSADISAEISSGEFIQIVGTIDTTTGVANLYINGLLAQTLTNPSVGDWAGNDGAGLGQTNGSINFGSPLPFDGEIAIFRHFNSALNATEAAAAYSEIAPPYYGLTVIELNGSPVLTGTSSLGAAVTIAADGSYTYDPLALPVFQALDTGESTIDSFDYTITDGSGTDTATVFVTVTGVNDTPSTAVASVTTNEDTNYTFSVADFPFSDIDTSDSIQSVTIDSLPAQGTLQLSGIDVIAGQNITVANITNLVFIPDADQNGSPYTTFDFFVSDGDANSATATMTINVLEVNDTPIANVPGLQIVDEDIDLAIAGISFTDIDAGGADVTVTLNVSNGMITIDDTVVAGLTPGDISNNGSSSVVLTGTTTEINSTMASAVGLIYRGTPNFNGADTLVVTINDGGNTGLDPGSTGTPTDEEDTATIAITVNPVNDAPSFSGLDATPVFVEGIASVVFDSNATISDPELDAIDNFDGASLTLQRNGGADSDDQFSNSGTLGILAEGGSLFVGATTVGTVTTNSGGTLILTFNNNANGALVDSVLQQIAYSNGSDNPPTNVVIDFTIDDGNTGSQGSGGALQGTGSITVSITPVNDPPVLDLDANDSTAVGADYDGAFTEGDLPIAIADVDPSISDPDDTNIESALFTLTNPQIGDVLTALDSDASWPISITATVNPGNDQVTLTGAATLAEYQTAITLIRFESTSDNPPTIDRNITVILNDGDNNSNVATSTIHVTAVPDLTISDAFNDEGTALVFDLTLDSAALDNIVLDLITTGVTATDSVDYENVNFEYSTDGGVTWLPAGGVNGTEVTIPTGSSAIQVRIDSIDDFYSEGSETMTLRVTSVVSGTIDSVSDTGTGTITDESPGDAAVVSIAGPASVIEGDSTTNYTIAVSQLPVSDVTVNLIYSGVAIDGTDFNGVASVIIPMNSMTTNFTLATIDDAIFEGAEGIVIDIDSIVGGGFESIVEHATNNQVITSIVDNDTPTIGINNINVTEDVDTWAEFTVSLSNVSFEDISFNIALSDLTAQGAGVDYGSTGLGNLQVFNGSTWVDATSATIAAGDTSVLVRTLVADDVLADDGETFQLTATVTSGTTVNPNASGIATIFDEATPDVALVSISGPGSVAEGTTTANYSVSVDQVPASDLTVNLTYSGTAFDGTDFNGVANVTILAGTVSVNFTLDTIIDSLSEGPETIIIDIASLVGGGFESVAEETSSNQVTTTIIDDDDLIWNLNGDGTVIESAVASYNLTMAGNLGAGESASITLSQSDLETIATDIGLVGSNQTDLMNAINASVTAYSGPGSLSFNTVSGILTYTAVSDGDVMANLAFSLAATNDNTLEEDERFTVAISAPGSSTGANVVLGGSTVVMTTITDDDLAIVSIAPTTDANESGPTDGVFTVSMSNPSATDTVINFSLSGTATSGLDYVAPAAQVTILAGTTQATIDIATIDDALLEGTESVSATLIGIASGDSNISIGGTTAATLNLLDDDSGAWAIIGDANVSEGASASYQISLSGQFQLNESAQVDLSISNLETATVDYANFSAAVSAAVTAYTGPGTYSFVGSTLTWTSTGGNQSPANLTITLLATDDAIVESTERFVIALSNPGSLTGADINLGATSAVTTNILDNDTATVSIAATTNADETGPGNGLFTVSITNPSSTDTTINYLTSGTASNGLDYGLLSGQVTIAAGSTSATISIPTIDDGIVEGTETVIITLDSIASGDPEVTIGGTSSASADLLDNDSAQWSITGDANVAEGANASYSIALSGSFQNGGQASVDVTLFDIDTTTSDYADFDTAMSTAVGSYTGNGTYSWIGSTLTWTADADNQPASSLTILLAVTDDAIAEADEDYFVGLSNPTSGNGATITVDPSNDDVTTSISANDSPAISVSNANASEGDPLVFNVTLSNPSATPITLDLNTIGVSATDGVDYENVNFEVSTDGGVTWNGAAGAGGTEITFAAGTTALQVRVDSVEDTIDEPDETFTLDASVIAGSVSGITTGTGTITNDDTPAVTVSNEGVTEGTDNWADFTVTLSNASNQPISFNLALADVTATGLGTDYGSTLTDNIQVSTDGGATWVDGTSVTFSPGTTSVLVRTAVVDDLLTEGIETFTLTATETTARTSNSNATGTATITDNESDPVVTIGNVSASEGDPLVFNVTLSNPSATPITLDLNTIGVSATDGADYENINFEVSTDGGVTWNGAAGAAGTEITFAAGTTALQVRVDSIEDTLDELSETFTLDASVIAGSVSGITSGTGTITNDDMPVVTVSNVGVTEGTDNWADFTVTLSNSSDQPVSFNLALADVTATGLGTDYGSTLSDNIQVSTDGGTTWVDGTSVTFSPGTTSVLVRTAIVDDLLTEGIETFTLTATETTARTSNSVASGTATIADNESDPVVTIGNGVASEGDPLVFNVTLSNPSATPITLDLNTIGVSATDGVDYENVNFEVSTDGGVTWNGAAGAGGTEITFAAGTTALQVRVDSVEDTIDELSETFTLDASVIAGSVSGITAGTGTITNDDMPVVTVSNVGVTEGTDNWADFTVTLSNGSDQPVSFNLALADVTATGLGTDYGSTLSDNIQVSTDGGTTWVDATSVTFAPGTTSVLVRTAVVDDLLTEGIETFTLTATETTARTSNSVASGTATIADNESDPVVTIGNGVASEGDPLVFNVTLSNPSATPITLDLNTIGGSATDGVDYENVNFEVSTDGGVTWNGAAGAGGTEITFAAGTTALQVRIDSVEDTIDEPDETFTLDASVIAGSVSGITPGTGTITNDDTPAVTVSNVGVTEGTDNWADFTVTLSNASDQPISFNLALADVTATGLGTDYGSTLSDNIQVSTDGGATWVDGTSVTFSPGTVSVLVRTAVVDDLLTEGIETFTLTATETTARTSNSVASGTATIADNESDPVVTIGNGAASEGDPLVFNVTLSNPSATPITLDLNTIGVSATDGIDYENVNFEVSTDGGVTWNGAAGAAGTEITFAAGTTALQVRIDSVEDTIDESNETFTLDASVIAGSVSGITSGTGTITNDDTPAVTVSNVGVTEGTDNWADFTVTLSNASDQPISFNLALADVTATGLGTDYGSTLTDNIQVSTDGGATWVDGTSVTFSPGTTSVLVRTAVVDDLLTEGIETFTLTATETTARTSNSNATGTATITDNESDPVVTIGNGVASEGDPLVFNVTLSNPSATPITLDLNTIGVSATDGIDYENVNFEVSTDGGVTWNGAAGAAGTEITFAAGTTALQVRIDSVEDTIDESNETFTLDASVIAGSVSGITSGTGTITNDDTPAVTVSNVGVTEGTDNWADFTVTLSNASDQPISFNLALADVTATGLGTDYGSTLTDNIQVSTDGGATWVDGTSVTFSPGTTSVLVRTAVVDDLLTEGIETFTLTATETTARTSNSNATGTATITDNESDPVVTIGNVSASEGDPLVFNVTLSNPSATPISLDLNTIGGTATDGVDYENVNFEVSTDGGVTWNGAAGAGGTEITFAAGTTALQVRIDSVEDTIDEPDETFTLDASVIAGSVSGITSGTGTITNDDTPAVTVSNVGVTEGTDNWVDFTVTLSNASDQPISFNLALADVTATGLGTDYGSTLSDNIQVSTDGGTTWVDGTSVTFSPGTTSVLVRTAIVDDLLTEGIETFTLTATETTARTSNSNATGTATITDNESDPVVTIGNGAASEGDPLVFSVTLSNPSATPITLDLNTIGGSATDGVDYENVNFEVSTDGGVTWNGAAGAGGTEITFAAGTTALQVRVDSVEDTIDESNETFTLDASVIAGSVSGITSGTGTITNDDTPAVTVSNVGVTEGTDNWADFTVTLSNASDQPISFNLALADVTATGLGTDYGSTLSDNIQVSTDGGTTWVDGTSVTFSPGTTSVLVRTAIVDDLLTEGIETFTLTASETTARTSNSNATGTATITDNESDPVVTIGNVSASEGDPLVFDVTLSNPSATPITLDLNTIGGSATDGVDYENVNFEVSTDGGVTWNGAAGAGGTEITFAAGTTALQVRVDSVEDTIDESDETFTLDASVIAGSVSGITTGTGTITNDDTPAVTVSNEGVTEGTDNWVDFTVTLSNASDQPISFNLALADVTATGLGTDYGSTLSDNIQVSTDGGTTWVDGTNVTFSPGTTSVLVRTAVVDDLLTEGIETFTLTATETTARTSNSNATGTATITDNEADPVVTIGNVSASEGDPLVFNVTLSNPSATPISLDLNTIGGTASDGVDYENANFEVSTDGGVTWNGAAGAGGTEITFAAGTTALQVRIDSVEDTLDELSETFTLDASVIAGSVSGITAGTGTITNDDMPVVTVSNVGVTEGTDNWADFTVTLSNGSDQPISFNLALADVTATGLGTDYGSTLSDNIQVSTDGGTTWVDGTSVTFSPGTTSVLVRTAVVDDLLTEGIETFTLTATETTARTSNSVASGTATIADNESDPVVTIGNGAASEGDRLVFNVTLSNPSATPITLDLNTIGVSATDGADYENINFEVSTDGGVTWNGAAGAGGTEITFAAGTTALQVRIDSVEDTIDESNETFTLDASVIAGSVSGITSGTGTITNDDTPAVTVSNVGVTEGTDNWVDFTVTLSNASDQPISFNLALADVTATGLGTDYGSTLSDNIQVSTDGGATWVDGTSVTFSPGTVSVLVRTAVVDDLLTEGIETFTLTATETTARTSNSVASGTATIADNESDPVVTIGNGVASEGDRLVFNVTLSNPSATPITLDLNTIGVSATDGADYENIHFEVSTDGGVTWNGAAGAGGTEITFAAGTTALQVRIDSVEDTIDESNETFTLDASVIAGSVSGITSGTGTITNDDTPAVTVSNVGVTEGTDNWVDFTVTLSNASDQPISFNLALADVTATGLGTDYGSTLSDNIQVSTDGGTTWVDGTSVTFSPGTTTLLVRTAVVDDLLTEGIETFTLTATETTARTSNSAASGTATITDNESDPVVTIGNGAASEGDPLVFNVTLSNPSATPITLDLNTIGVSATDGVDYENINFEVSTDGGVTWNGAAGAGGTEITFAAGTTALQVRIDSIEDLVHESDETFVLDASVVSGSAGTILSSTGTILNDDFPVVSVSNPSVVEGVDAYAEFIVSLSIAADTAVTFDLTLTDGTATGSGTDYGSSLTNNIQVSVDGGATWNDATSATFAPGTTSVLVRTPVFDDVFAEGAEDFTLTVTESTLVTSNSSSSGIATINDEAIPDSATVSLTGPVSVNEGSTTTPYTVAVNETPTSDISINLLYSGTATDGSDFTGVTSATIVAGTTNAQFTINTIDDVIAEGVETIVVDIDSIVGGGFESIVEDPINSRVTTTIQDNDLPTLSINDVTIDEDAGTITFDVALSTAWATPVTVNWATVAGTASSGSDFVSDSNILVFAAGETLKPVTVAINNDNLFEGSEQFTIELSGATGAAIADSTGVGTIVDDGSGPAGSDDDTPLLIISDFVVVEGINAYGNFTLSLSNPSTENVEINLVTVDGTAVGGSDYGSSLEYFNGASWIPVVGNLVLPAGITSVNMRASITNDTIADNNEQFSILATTVSGTTSNPNATGVGTILDNAVAFPDTNIVLEDTGPVNGNLITNDDDAVSITQVEGAAVNVGIPLTSLYGTITINSDGTYSYLLDNNNPVVDGLAIGDTLFESFTYQIVDGNGGTDTSTLTITINGSNDPPVANLDVNSVVEDQPVNVVVGDMTANDTDVDGPVSELSIVSIDGDTSGTITGIYGTLSWNLDGTYSYALDNANPNTDALPAGATVTEVFNYVLSDKHNALDSSAIIITITGANDAPVAGNPPDQVGMTANPITPLDVSLLANDVDTGDSVTFSDPSGSLPPGITISPAGTLSGSPTTEGVFAVSVLVTDTLGATTTISFQWTVNNNPPLAVDDYFLTDEDTVITVDLRSNDIDPDFDPLQITQLNGNPIATGQTATLPSGASVTLNADGTISYQPGPVYQSLRIGDSATDNFTYSITDTEGDVSSAQTFILINGVNDPPVANDDTVTVTTGSQIDISVLSNDFDPESEPLAVMILSGPSNGVATVNPDGTVTYRSNNNFEGIDQITYLIEDPHGASSQAVINIEVLPAFRFDSFTNFSKSFSIQSPYGLDDMDRPTNRLLSQEIFTLAAEPIFSGYARPGTQLVGRIYDSSGAQIGEQYATADPGGNWMMQFHDVKSNDFYRIEFEQIAGAIDYYGYLGLNPADNTYQAMEPLTQYDESLTVQSALKNLPTEALKRIIEQNDRSIGFGESD